MLVAFVSRSEILLFLPVGGDSCLVTLLVCLIKWWCLDCRYKDFT
uniref:Uncharacterized protein n=1 Tax=Arundo donax TaxID=35708 RepID=A0A0A9AF82_ARUDO